MRRALSFLAKLVVSGLLLYLALNWVNLGRVASRLSQIDPAWLALALLAPLAQKSVMLRITSKMFRTRTIGFISKP